MGSILRPDAKALVWATIGALIVPKVFAFATNRMG